MSRSIQASPGNAVYYYNLGAVYNARNEPDEAIACYRKALALKPDDAEILNNLGVLASSIQALSCQSRCLTTEQAYRIADSYLCDAPSRSRKMEAAYRETWRTWVRTRG